MSRNHSSQSAVLLALMVLLTAGTATAARRPVQLSGAINLNTATATELRLLPGVGAKKVERILELRSKHPFQNTDQLLKVKGFGRVSYRRLKPYLAVNGATTLKRSAAPAAPHAP